MSNEVGYQVGIFVLCCIAGVVVALLFDVFRISRRVVRTSTVATCVEDLMFWIISALFMFALSLKFNDGEIRWYMFLGLAFGAIIYFGTLSRFVVKCSVAVISFFKKLLITIFEILLFPIKIILRLLNKPFFMVMSFGRRGCRRIWSIFTFKLQVFRKFSFKTIRRKKSVD